MRLELTVKARAREDRAERLPDGRLKVWVKAAPEKGRANEAVLAVLSDYLAVPRSRLELVRGHTAARKVVEVK